MKELLPRIARWLLQLQEYTFTVQYRPGNRLQHVDALSRNPSATENRRKSLLCELNKPTGSWVQLTNTKIQYNRTMQQKSPDSEYPLFILRVL